MIILQDLYSILATGAYANTVFSGTDGILKTDHYEKVANLVNMGVLEIHKRFKFLENELILHVVPEVTNYYLRPDRTTSVNNLSATEYIEEVFDVDGFLNIIKVTAAYNLSGAELDINVANSRVVNPYKPSSELPKIIQLAPDILQITNIIVAQPLNVVYQSYPTKIPVTNYDPDGYELNIPDIIIDPLISFIAAKTFKPMGANDSTANADKSASYEQQYELACQKLMLYGLSVQDNTERDTFDSNGWV